MILNDAKCIVSHQPYRFQGCQAGKLSTYGLKSTTASLKSKEHPSKALPKRFSSEKSNGNDSTPQGGVANVFFSPPLEGC